MPSVGGSVTDGRLLFYCVLLASSAMKLSLLASVAVAVLVYAVLVYGMKIITWYDCQVLPKGDLIARLLRVKAPEGDTAD